MRGYEVDMNRYAKKGKVMQPFRIMTNFKTNPNIECKHAFVALENSVVMIQCMQCGLIKIHLGWLLMRIDRRKEKERLRKAHGKVQKIKE